MTLTLDHPHGHPAGADLAPPDPPGEHLSAGVLLIGGIASLVAGAIHVAAVAAHSDHRQAVWAFAGLAVVQIAWGASTIARPRRWLAAGGLAIGLVSLGGWALAKTRGIPIIDGLGDKEPVRFSDATAAGLSVAVVVAALATLFNRRIALPKILTAAATVAIIGIGVPGASAAVDHPHGDGHTLPDGTVQVASAVPPQAFDPSLPIDLGGVPGVSPEQQARAENVLAATVLRLPQWADPAFAEANGFRSIGDGATGTEHMLNPEFMADDAILDPDRPESLVFDVDTSSGRRSLSAAMYMMPPGSTLDDVPDLGGALTQWHIHNNLCFNTEGQVRGLTDSDGNCAAPLVEGPETPMIHVWIRPHPCGPFAALEGVGGGQVREGEVVNCDELHGS